MHKLLKFLILSIAFTHSGCKKTKTLNIRFEVVTTSAVASPAPSIITKVGLGTAETSSNFSSGTVWTKEFSTDTDYRPLEIILNAQNVVLSSAGSVTASIFLNGEKKTAVTIATSLSGGQHIANATPLAFTVER